MNLQLEQHRDELSKAKIDIAELSNQLEHEREQMHQIQEMNANDMNTLSERWTQDRQQLREQISDMSMDIVDLRKTNEELEAHAQDLMAMRNEEANRHDQELGDLVGEYEDKEQELARAQEELQNLEDLLQARDARISELLDRIDQLELARREADAVHDEVVSSIKSVYSRLWVSISHRARDREQPVYLPITNTPFTTILLYCMLENDVGIYGEPSKGIGASAGLSTDDGRNGFDRARKQNAPNTASQ